MKHSRESSFWKTGCVTKQSSHYSLTLSLSPLTLLFHVSSCSRNMYFSYLCLHYLSFFIDCTAWKVSKYGVFSGPYFPVFGQEKTPYLSTFPAVLINSNSNLYQHFSSSLLMCPDGVKVKFSSSFDFDFCNCLHLNSLIVKLSYLKVGGCFFRPLLFLFS